ncbi:uncharacterized protein LOC144436009 isoform X1 [Glandiceps talaboti]
MSWKLVNELYYNKCPNFLEVVDLILSLPAGTSECERGFSLMKITKTQYRNKLKSSSMTLLMTVQLHSPDISEFDPTPAIHQWNQHAKRRPSFIERSHSRTRDPEQVIDELHDAAAVLPEHEDAHDKSGDAYNPDSDYDSDFSDLLETDDSTGDLSDV